LYWVEVGVGLDVVCYCLLDVWCWDFGGDGNFLQLGGFLDGVFVVCREGDFYCLGVVGYDVCYLGLAV